MSPFAAEIIGTAVMMLLGNGVIANVLLKQTKGSTSGSWLLISTGWGFAIFCAVEIAAPYSGAHLNPAVSIGFAVAQKFEWAKVPLYIIAQMIGAMLGGFLTWVLYRAHFKLTTNEEEMLMCFSTVPALKKYSANFTAEVIGTFILIFTVLYIKEPSFVTTTGKDVPIGLGAIGALPVALIVWGIVISLGGNTGCALNPARDLGPRIIHAVLPIKGSSDWQYAWIPVIGPITGSILAAICFLIL